MIYCYKREKTKKSFWLQVLFLTFFGIKNLYAVPDFAKIGLYNVPGIALCGAKLMMPQTADTFLGSTQIVNFIENGPEVIPQLVMIGCNIYIGYMLLHEKKSLPAINKHPETGDLAKVKNFTGTIVFSTLGEVVILYLLQCGILWYQQKLNYKTVSIAGAYNLIQVIPSIIFVLMKKNQ